MPKFNFSGWRRQPADPRDRFKFTRSDRKFAATIVLDFSTVPEEDQADLGSCGPNTDAELIAYADHIQNLPVKTISRLHHYWWTRYIMGTTGSDSGVDNRSMMKALATYGVVPDESLWPYDTSKFTQKPPDSINQIGLKNLITDYAAVVQSLDQMRGCLSDGHPFCFGFDVYSQIESDQAAQTGILTDPSGSSLGGHDVSIFGFSSVDQPGRKPGNKWPANHFCFRNHWTNPDGTPWGDCLTGDTEIQLLNGTSRSIQDLAEEGDEIWVYSYDTEKGRIVPALAKPVPSGHRQDFVRVTLDNGESVVCTEDHKWLMRNGKFRKAIELKEGDSLMPLYLKNDRGYERFYAPHNHRWITTHWSVAHDQDLRDQHGHTPDCHNPKCRLVVHHYDLNARNNQPDNLHVMYECRHHQEHRTLTDSFNRSEKMKERWRNDDGTMASNSRKSLQRYNEMLQNGEVEVTEAQIQARIRNAAGASKSAAEKVARDGITESQRRARAENAARVGKLPRTEEWLANHSKTLKENYAAGMYPRTAAQEESCRQNIIVAQEAAAKKMEEEGPTEAQRNARRENMRKLNASGKAYRNHKVVSIEPFNLLLPVYDLKVNRKNCHNFALSCGVFVHNSGVGYVSAGYATGPHASDFWVINTIPGGVTPVPVPPGPVPVPIPVPIPTPIPIPTPSPVPAIKAKIDALFIALEQQFAWWPQMKQFLTQIQAKIDAILAQYSYSPAGISTVTMIPRSVITIIFAGIDAAATEYPMFASMAPILKMAIQALAPYL